MQARRLLATLFAVAMFSSSCAMLSTPTAADVPPPPVDDTIRTEAAFPDDGLTRLIVTPIAVTFSSAGGADSVTDGEEAPDVPPGDPFPVDPFRVLTPEMVAAMPPGAVLEARDGKVGYIDVNGTFVAFDPAILDPVPTPDPEPEAAEEPATEIEPLYGNPYIDQLAADPAVENIIVVGDGTYGVETSDPSVIDPAVFDSVEDVPFAIFQDQYERYQWYLENNGSNLDRLGSIPQAEDADLDIEPTLGRSTGKGVVVAVIDSGVDFSHPDLENSAWSNLGEVCGNGIDDEGNGYIDDCNGWDFANNDAQPYSAGSLPHGTHVAGIIAADRDGRGVAGVAPGARIMDLNVAYGNGSMSSASIAAATRYAADNGADIINMSLGTNPGASGSSMRGVREAIDYAATKGVIVVVAAGNSNVDIGSLAVYPASFDRPNMIVVGASSPDDSKAGFSNYSAGIVDLYAPGEMILSTMPGNDFQFMSGTSMASPATAGVAALLVESSPDADLSTVIEQIVSSVDPVDALSTSITSGRANAASALGLGDAPPIPSELDVSVAGLLGASNEVNAEVAIVTPPEVFDEDYRWELSLITSTNAGAYAVVEHAFVVDGLETATGVTGAVLLGSSAMENVAVSTQLPDGQYSFVIEAVPTADGSSRLGDVFVTTFQVGDGTVEVDDSPTVTTSPVGVTSTTALGTDPTDGTSADGSTTTAPVSGGNNSSTTTPTEAGTPEPTAPGTTASGSSPSTTTAPTQGGSSPTTAPIVEPGTPATTAPITTTPVTPTTGGGGNGGADTDGGDAPGTSAPPTASPPSTSPPSTMPTSPPSTPPNVGDDSAVEGEWEISSISPQAGYVDNANSVTIRGSFPQAAYVWFGEQPGQVVHQTDDLITVRTPLRSADGVVDVSLRATGVGTVLTVPDAFAFVTWGTDEPAPGDPGAGVAPGDGSNGGDTGSGDSDPGDGSNGGDTGSDDSDQGDSGSDDRPDDSTATDRQPRMIVGSAVDLPSGLKGAAITPNPAANTPVCSTDPCAATRR